MIFAFALCMAFGLKYIPFSNFNEDNYKMLRRCIVVETIQISNNSLIKPSLSI